MQTGHSNVYKAGGFIIEGLDSGIKRLTSMIGR
jgi:hypothetical protein